MLVSLHVKNLALIEETEVEFGEGLNILTGETGAGKSILIGSVNLALGARFDKDMLRQGAESALVELMFTCPPEDKALREKINGAAEREKFRIRYYHDDFSLIKLEKKQKKQHYNREKIGKYSHAAE